jgi:hypothetical protein
MRPTVSQVCGDGLADIGRQRHWCGPTTFTVHGHLAGFPIDIFQIERNNFSGPQAQPGEQQQDRAISPAQRRLAITTIHNVLYRSRWEKLGQCGLRPIRDNRHASGQIQRDFSAITEVTEKGSEGRHEQFGSSRA